MNRVKPVSSKLRKEKKQLQTQKQELNDYMKQPGFSGQLPIGQEDAQKQRDYIKESIMNLEAIED